MDKRRLYRLIEWSVALAACVFLIWKLATYEQYDTVLSSLRAMDRLQGLALLVCVVLMPVNMSLEAWRWKTLIPMSWREAHRQVYYSKLAGLITPWRLGEYAARGVLMEQSINSNNPSPLSSQNLWPKVFSMGAVGSATMTAAIVGAGIIGIIGDSGIIGEIGIDGKGYCLLIGVILLLLGVGLYFAPRLLRRWADVSHQLVLTSLLQSFVRLACWCVQLGLVLYALGALCSPLSTFHLLPIYYLLVTVTPSVPVVEVGVRGAWAMVLFGTPNAALAGVLLWVVNTLLPCMIWPFIRKK